MVTSLSARDFHSLIDELNKNIKGRIFTKKDAGYQTRIELDNGRIQRRPAAVVLVSSADDIIQVLKIAEARSCPLTVKAGGHSYAGYCLNDSGIVIDLAELRQIDFLESEQALQVQMGARWSDVYSFLSTMGSMLVPVGGTCLSVGVAGFILGGGYSFLSRSYGLGADSIIRLKIVTADGRLREISAESTGAERELFWACLGAGGGNFGIVVEATLRMHLPKNPTIMGGTLIYPMSHARSVVGFYNEWIRGVPDELTVYGYIGYLPDPARPAESTLCLRLQPVFNGSFEEGQRLVKPLMDFAPREAHFFNLTLHDYLLTCDKFTAVEGRQSYMRSGMLPAGALTEDVVSAFEKFMSNAPSKESFMLWMHQGGKTNAKKSADTAFVHRSASFIFEIVAMWRKDQDLRTNVEWAYHFAETLSGHFTGAFVNYIDPLLVDWQKKYYGDNYERLCEIKRYWDPKNIFSFQQSIGSAHSPSAAMPLNLEYLSRT